MLPSFLIDLEVRTLDQPSDQSLAEYEAAGSKIIYYDRLCWPAPRTFARTAHTNHEFEIQQSDRNFGNMMPKADMEVVRSPPIWPLRDLEMPESDLSIEHLNSLLYTDGPAIDEPKASLWPLDDLQCVESNHVDAVKISTVREGAKMAVADLYTTEGEETEHINKSTNKATHRSSNYPGTTITEAQHSVLLTAELLEIILSFLPSTDLWRMTYVCHSWSELIMSSPTLRTNLWFKSRAAPQTPTRGWGNQNKVQFICNPILESLNIVHGNTLTYNYDFYTSFNFPARWRTVKAPWRDMQICEPPIQQVFLSSSWLNKYLHCETGITAGQIADRVELSRTGTLRTFHSV
jgi:hypothetical protein